MARILGNISCDIDPLTLGSRSTNVFSCNCISLAIGHSNFQTLQVHKAHYVEGNASCYLDPRVKVKSNISCKCISF